MAEVSWTIEALDDVASIRAYIAQFDNAAAQRIAQALLDAGDRLNTFPNRGAPAGGELRKLTLVWPYIVRYRVSGDRVLILGVRHGSRAND